MLPGQLSPNTANDFGMAVYLAENDIDVWGIDQAWTMVPAEVTDHSFMEDWGIDRQVRDLKIAMAVARVLRYRTGNGVGKMLLAGYSSGVATGFAMVNDEAVRPSFTRHVKGLIPIDLSLNSEDEGVIATVKGDHDRLTLMMESGSFGEFIPFRLVGNLARTNPGGDSPVIPGFSNLQTALFFGAGPFVQGSTFHYLAGVWAEDFPSGLKYVTLDQWFDFLEAGVPWEAARFISEYNAWMSGLMDLPWDDNFGKVTVPILNVNPAGGFGKLNESSTKLLGSKDITQLNLQLESDEDVLYDFAHIDIFIANNAEEVAWKPIMEWIKVH